MPSANSLYKLKPNVNGRSKFPVRWGLVEHWNLDEASGTRAGVNGNTLTDNNTVTQAAGKMGNAAQFTAVNTEYLSVADNAALSTGDVDFWMGCWVYFDSTGAYLDLISKDTSGQRELGLFFDLVATQLAFVVFPDGVNGIQVNASTLGTPSLTTWYFVLAWHDSVNNTINIKVNNGATDATSHSTGVRDGMAPFTLGARSDGFFYLNGRLDEVSFGKSPPGGIAGVISEISSRLYNGGAGLSYPWN